MAGAGRRAPAVRSVRSDPRSAEPEGSSDRPARLRQRCALPRGDRRGWSRPRRLPLRGRSRPAAHASAARSWRRRPSASPRRATTIRRLSSCTRAAPAGGPKVVRYTADALFTALAHGRRQRAVFAQFLDHRRSGYREMRAHRTESVGHQLRRFYEANAWFPSAVDLQRADVAVEARFEEARSAINAFRPEVLLRIRLLCRRSLSVGFRAAPRAPRAANRVVRGGSHGGRRP